MDKVMVLDGDFRAQICNYLQKDEMEHPHFELQILMTNRFAVYKTHLDFLRAGCHVIRTNTHRASVQSFTRYLQISPSEGTHLINIAVQLAKKAVYKYYEETDSVPSNRQFLSVAGTCGSYAAANFDDVNDCLPYWDTISEHSLIDWHRSRMQALLNAGVDILALESIPCVKEVEALMKLLQEFPNARAWITFFCPNGKELMDGRDFYDIAVLCYRSLPGRILAIGANCSSPTLMTSALRRINDYIYPQNNIPLVACPDKQLTYYTDGSFDCDSLASHVCEWLVLGVRYVGGATNVTADDMEDVCKEVNNCYTYSHYANRTVPNACCIAQFPMYLRNKKDKSKI